MSVSLYSGRTAGIFFPISVVLGMSLTNHPRSDTAVVPLTFLRPLEGRFSLRFVVDVSGNARFDAWLSAVHAGMKRGTRVPVGWIRVMC